LRIAVDSRMMYMSGIGRYIRSSLLEMARLDADLTFDMLGNSGDFQRFLNEQGVDCRRFHHSDYFPAIYSLGEQLGGSRKMLKAQKADVVHFPHFNAPWLCPDCSVVTVHDLIPFKLPHFYNPFRLKVARQVLKNAVEKAARIIVVSDATAADLEAMFPGRKINEKIRRTYLGVSEGFQPMELAEVELFKAQNNLGDYILYVGNRLPHKNLGRLARAVINLQKAYPDLQLVVAGKRFKENDELDQVKRSIRSEAIVEWGSANDDELQALYNGARVLAFPSLYEGFGLPALEAMACGTPVVVSNCSSLPEVVGQAGIYVDPYEVHDIARGINQMLADPALRERMSTAGLEQARRFSWEDTARQTLAVYREVVGNPANLADHDAGRRGGQTDDPNFIHPA